jgi:transforming growth factor-beta-induced protein
MIRLIRHVLLLGCVALVAACGGGGEHPAPVSIAATATANPNLSALVAAATKAGLVPTLSAADTKLTVLAPTDAAFTALATRLGFASATALVNGLSADTLRSILQYHVLTGSRTAAAIAASSNQPTTYNFPAGTATSVAVSVTNNEVRLTDAVLTAAQVVTADVAASNGVVHVIDKVLVPPGVLNVVQMALLNPSFSSLTDALAARNLVATLSGAGPFTVFAPTNTAFAAAPAGLTADQLSTVLTYHVLGSQVLSSGIPFGTPVTTLAPPRTITITAGPAPAIASIADSTATPARITAVDIRASNGVIHVIDKVLIPSPL